MNSHSHYNYGKALLPFGVELFFPPTWDWEKCRKHLRERGLKLTSGRWWEYYERTPKTMMDWFFQPPVKAWSVKNT